MDLCAFQQNRFEPRIAKGVWRLRRPRYDQIPARYVRVRTTRSANRRPRRVTTTRPCVADSHPRVRREPIWELPATLLHHPIEWQALRESEPQHDVLCTSLCGRESLTARHRQFARCQRSRAAARVFVIPPPHVANVAVGSRSNAPPVVVVPVAHVVTAGRRTFRAAAPSSTPRTTAIPQR